MPFPKLSILENTLHVQLRLHPMFLHNVILEKQILISTYSTHNLLAIIKRAHQARLIETQEVEGVRGAFGIQLKSASFIKYSWLTADRSQFQVPVHDNV